MKVNFPMSNFKYPMSNFKFAMSNVSSNTNSESVLTSVIFFLNGSFVLDHTFVDMMSSTKIYIRKFDNKSDFQHHIIL